MLMGTTSINQLLSCISTKHKLSYHLALVLEDFEGNAVNVVVVCDTDYQPTEAHKGTLSRVWLAIPAIITVSLRVMKYVTRCVFEVTRYVIHVTRSLNYVTRFLS